MRIVKVTLVTGDRNALLIKSLKIARTLRQNGYAAGIVTWDRNGGRSKIEEVEGCPVHNFRLKAGALGKWTLLPGYLAWWCHVFFFLLRDNSDLYHVENLPNLIPVILANIIKRRKVIYDISDFLADSFGWSSLVRILLYRLERHCLRFADGVITVDEHRMCQIAGANIKRLAVIMNCPSDQESKSGAGGSEDGFTIYFGGWISEMRGLIQICKAIHQLEGVKLIIAGYGPDEKRFRRIFQAQENVEFRGLLSKAESLELTSQASEVFAFYDPRIPINRLASPNKLFDAMMCGKPILANEEALPVAEIIRREKCGLLVPYDDIEGLRNAIVQLKKNSHMRIEMGQNGRKAFEREYNWAQMEARLLKLYKEVDPNNVR